MPNIDQVPPYVYHPLDNYNYLVDNVPLNSIFARIEFINNAVDIASDQIRGAIGNAGSLANRLSVALDVNGGLIASAVDTSLHNIGAHTDGSYSGVDYVRMTQDERDKLNAVDSDATSLSLQIDPPVDDPVIFDTGVLEIAPSAGIQWDVLTGSKIRANLTFPMTAIHRHYYDQTPVPQTTLDYLNYKVSGSSITYVDDSIRVCVNGYVLSQDSEIEVPVGVDAVPTLLMYTADIDGNFTLSNEITSVDLIRVDFAISLTTGGSNVGPNSPIEVTGSRTDGTALTSLLTALATLGVITDSTTA